MYLLLIQCIFLQVVDANTVNCLIPAAMRTRLNIGLTLQMSVAFSDPANATEAQL